MEVCLLIRGCRGEGGGGLHRFLVDACVRLHDMRELSRAARFLLYAGVVSCFFSDRILLPGLFLRQQQPYPLYPPPPIMAESKLPNVLSYMNLMWSVDGRYIRQLLLLYS